MNTSPTVSIRKVTVSLEFGIRTSTVSGISFDPISFPMEKLVPLVYVSLPSTSVLVLSSASFGWFSARRLPERFSTTLPCAFSTLPMVTLPVTVDGSLSAFVSIVVIFSSAYLPASALSTSAFANLILPSVVLMAIFDVSFRSTSFIDTLPLFVTFIDAALLSVTSLSITSASFLMIISAFPFPVTLPAVTEPFVPFA